MSTQTPATMDDLYTAAVAFGFTVKRRGKSAIALSLPDRDARAIALYRCTGNGSLEFTQPGTPASRWASAHVCPGDVIAELGAICKQLRTLMRGA